jgi:hypothetical protein
VSDIALIKDLQEKKAFLEERLQKLDLYCNDISELGSVRLL